MKSSSEIKEAALFFGVTLGLSYLVFWGPLALGGVTAISFVNGRRGPLWAVVLFIAGGFVPSAVGIVLTAVRGGGPALRRLLRRTLQVRIGLFNYLGIVVLISAATATQLLVDRLLGHHFALGLFFMQLGSAVPLIVIGPLSEEL